MPEENNRREHPDARRDEGKSCGVIQDLKNIFDLVMKKNFFYNWSLK